MWHAQGLISLRVMVNVVSQEDGHAWIGAW